MLVLGAVVIACALLIVDVMEGRLGHCYRYLLYEHPFLQAVITPGWSFDFFHAFDNRTEKPTYVKNLRSVYNTGNKIYIAPDRGPDRPPNVNWELQQRKRAQRNSKTQLTKAAHSTVGIVG